MQYMNHHKEIIQPQVPGPLPWGIKNIIDICQTPLDRWDGQFIDRVGENPERVCNLICDAEYLCIIPLLYLACAKIALNERCRQEFK